MNEKEVNATTQDKDLLQYTGRLYGCLVWVFSHSTTHNHHVFGTDGRINTSVLLDFDTHKLLNWYQYQKVGSC